MLFLTLLCQWINLLGTRTPRPLSLVFASVVSPSSASSSIARETALRDGGRATNDAPPLERGLPVTPTLHDEPSSADRNLNRSRKLQMVAPLNVFLEIKDRFDERRSEIEPFVFRSYASPDGTTTAPSTEYTYDDFMAALQDMALNGVAGKTFFINQEQRGDLDHGFVNVAAFLANAMSEGIRYDSCDEVNFHAVQGRNFALSNSCGQLSLSYEDELCTASTEEEGPMACPVDTAMSETAIDRLLQTGTSAPPPLACRPKRNPDDFTGFWDSTTSEEVESAPYPNANGRTDTAGCCWWGRGVLRSHGVCHYGRLNYYLGRNASLDGRPSRYPGVDFCASPGVVCGSKHSRDLKWISGLFDWMDRVQRYSDVDFGWDYFTQLELFTDGGMRDSRFIDAVSSIVSRGCHDIYCSSHTIPYGEERRTNFFRLLDILDLPNAESVVLPPNSSPVSGPGGGRTYVYEDTERWLHNKRETIEGNIFVSYKPNGTPYFSRSYDFPSFLTALRKTARDGIVASSFAEKLFFLGRGGGLRDFNAGLVNLAAFLANAMAESIGEDSCDEINWEHRGFSYAERNSCGMNDRSYSDEGCPPWQASLACSADLEMEINGTVTAPFPRIFAPPPLQCRVGDTFTGYWDAKTGKFADQIDLDSSLEGCCWWGRGALMTRGTCNMGKQNFYMGKKASTDGRISFYPDIDFCRHPDAICTHPKSMEIRWVSGMFEWIDRVQDYYDSTTGWNYMESLYTFVDEGMDDNIFIDSVNRIVAIDCHTASASGCRTDTPHLGLERRENFKNILELVFDISFITKAPALVATLTMSPTEKRTIKSEIETPVPTTPSSTTESNATPLPSASSPTSTPSLLVSPPMPALPSTPSPPTATGKVAKHYLLSMLLVGMVSFLLLS